MKGVCLYARIVNIIPLVLLLIAFSEAIGCQRYNGGSNCPAHAPCCQSGWCSNAQSFCSIALGCQPENSFSPNTCLPLPQCSSFHENFDDPSSVIPKSDFSGDPLDAPWISEFTPNNARVENGNLVLTLQPGNTLNAYGNRAGFGATVSSSRWMLYGTVSARIKSGSASGGVISSFIFRNAMTGDEIDYEWVGKQPNEIQSNFYWHTPASMDPKDIDYTHSLSHQAPRSTETNATNSAAGASNLSQDYHIYTIEWLPDSLTWFIDNQKIRTLLRSEVNGTKYPSSLSQIQFSIWDGGLAHPATRDWAGGPTDWSDNHPIYEMHVDWVDIKCSTPVDPATTPWPPKDEGFQGFVNPMARDPTSPLAKEAIVLGENAPLFSTRENGGMHWGRFYNGGKNLLGKDMKSEAYQRHRGHLWATLVMAGSMALITLISSYAPM